MVSVEEAPASRLVAAIERAGALEWYRCGNGTRLDGSASPPSAVRRCTEPHPALERRIREAVDGYRGVIEWTLIEHHRRPNLGGVNWALFPAELRRVQLERGLGTDSSAASVLASERPDWFELAVNDFKNLVAVVEECLTS
jgi:hypothetical protein